MKKLKILVRDNKKIFLKLFRNKLDDEFEFVESSFLKKDRTKLKDFHRIICVAYNKDELFQFFKCNKMQNNILVCLFDTKLYDSVSFLEEMNSLISLDTTRTSIEITKELKAYFNIDTVSEVSEITFPSSRIMQTQFDNFYKGLFFLM